MIEYERQHDDGTAREHGEAYEHTYDLVVVGSGAGGLTAALAAKKKGLSVLLVEKAPHFGGSSARSGGGVWIPNNSVLRRDGVRDSPEAARTYLHAIVDGVDPDRIDTYLDRGPEVLDFVLANSALELEWVRDYSDYYPEAPGGRLRGRSVEPKPFDTYLLGDRRHQLEPDYAKSPANMVVMQSDFKWLNLLIRTPRGPLRGLKVAARLLAAKARNRNLVGRGQALIGGIAKGVFDAGVDVWLETPMTGLITEDSPTGRRVAGITVTRSGQHLSEGSARGGNPREEKTLRIRARRGVILTSGGFEHNAEMRAQYQRQPIGTEWTVGATANTGDGIRAAQDVGASLSFMDDAWWGPTIQLSGGPWFALAERSLPGSIMINDRGERFMNESLPYVEATHRMYGGEYGQGDGPGENIPAWLVFDQRYRNRYMFAAQGPRQPLPGRWFKNGHMVRAGSIAELAEKIGVPADALTRTVERFNAFAASGVDEDFKRGQSGYDHYYGDPTNKPNPSLAALTKPPFYAATMVPGDLGTKGGIDTDVHGRALRADGSPIPGLYASGNCASPVMGHTYAGPGATIGPAMVFAYLAVEHAVDNADVHTSAIQHVDNADI